MHRQQNDLASRMLDDGGRLKPFAQWKKEVLPIASHYNTSWLQTEYSTAILRARTAAKFRKFERDADLFPNLKWLPSTSIDKREGHIAFYGLVKPLDDPFWKLHYPGNIWNCKCGITNTDDKPTSYTPTTTYQPAPGLDVSPATGKLFNTDTHPYKTKAYVGAAEAVEKYLITIDNELRERAYKALKDWRNSIHPYKGLRVESDRLITGKLTILRRSVDEVKEHNATWRDILYLPKIEHKVKDWEYLGYEPVKHSKTFAEYMLFYKAKIGSKERLIEVLIHKHFGEILYCIVPMHERELINGIPLKK
ncbi:MAG: phage minor head protein [Bacteroidales bacterium]